MTLRLSGRSRFIVFPVALFKPKLGIFLYRPVQTLYLVRISGYVATLREAGLALNSLAQQPDRLFQ